MLWAKVGALAAAGVSLSTLAGTVHSKITLATVAGAAIAAYCQTTGVLIAAAGGNPSGASSVTHQYSRADSRPSST
jgi:hypothetical protein